MNKGLIVVDYQYDFVAEDGKLPVGQAARDIEKHIKELAEAYDEGDIYFTFDDHSEKDWEDGIIPETKAFDKHCLAGTKGYEIWGDIKGCKNENNHIKKHAYCPSKEDISRLVSKYNQITVVGVVTDICVFQTVIGLYTEAVNTGKPVALIVDRAGCASFNPEREKMALDYMAEVLSVSIV